MDCARFDLRVGERANDELGSARSRMLHLPELIGLRSYYMGHEGGRGRWCFEQDSLQRWGRPGLGRDRPAAKTRRGSCVLRPPVFQFALRHIKSRTGFLSQQDDGW